MDNSRKATTASCSGCFTLTSTEVESADNNFKLCTPVTTLAPVKVEDVLHTPSVTIGSDHQSFFSSEQFTDSELLSPAITGYLQLPNNYWIYYLKELVYPTYRGKEGKFSNSGDPPPTSSNTFFPASVTSSLPMSTSQVSCQSAISSSSKACRQQNSEVTLTIHRPMIPYNR
ncbi:hypothetical protein TTRE_0000209801 [Trichuris trichiura]|uniref:Uncharacterized protein n=1 Tax=Trichuris trichiura TaxID=36087 RepID=A0A077Z193_TRITR|nr:hypothetical protein TTRE_0000209801 [Trichuris trichiura]